MSETNSPPVTPETVPASSVSAVIPQGFEIESLFQAAWNRTRGRLVNYILTVLLMLAMILGAALISGIAFAILGVLFVGTRDTGLTITVGSIVIGLLVIGGLYVGSWGGLAGVFTLISPHTITAIDAYKQMSPLVWGYVWVTVLLTLFVFGILPLSIFTLFILTLLWFVWGVFTIFVYIEKRPPGLGSLWMSKAIVNTRFWGVFGRILLVNGLIFGIYYAVLFATRENQAANTILSLASYVITPFIISFQYEIYRQLNHPKSYPRPTVWIVLSIIGWVLIAIIFSSTATRLLQELPDALRNIDTNFRNIQTGII